MSEERAPIMYKCVKSFSVEITDGDGFTLDNEEMYIPVGSVWYLPEEEDYRFIGGEVRLESDDIGWIEIPKDRFRGHFVSGEVSHD